MASQRDVRNKISSVKNIQKITRAMEMVACRKAPAGEYVVNVHAYAFLEKAAIPVRIFVRRQRPGQNAMETLLTKTTTIDHNGQEVTIARFTLNPDGDLVAGSVSDPLAPSLRDALNAWVDAARGLASAIAGNYGPDEFNAAISKLNDTKTTALDLCDAAYR